MFLSTCLSRVLVLVPACCYLAGHDSDINCCDWCPNSHSFATASDDSSCRLFDIRSLRQIGCYSHPNINCSITSVVVSKSMQFLLAGYDDFKVRVWSLFHGHQPVSELKEGHQNRVSCMGLSADGFALATGSWDMSLLLWA